MKPTLLTAAAIVLTGGIAGCASLSDAELARQAADIMRASFKERGQAKLDRLNQDAPQAVCSLDDPAKKPPVADLERMEKAQQALIKYPADGRLLGDWREGEKIAQSGVGKQFSDNPANPSGGNCYACHQMSPQEISFGTIGPPLLHYGKLRGNSEAIQRYTYGKIYNPQAFTACSNMPRFGHNGILTEQQIKHLTALLLDPSSPVNR
ncbi:MAG: sulfur oxidation c-type cytochrome SoxX [Burkholderiales bacterium]|nr:sulfur oxidation c-type cytochrome SoxX [Burkholderiales bacterium]